MNQAGEELARIAHAEWVANEDLEDFLTKRRRDVDAQLERLLSGDPTRADDVAILRVMSASDAVEIALRHVQAPERFDVHAQLDAAMDGYVAAVAALPTTPRTAAFRSEAMAWQSSLLPLKDVSGEQLVSAANAAFDARARLVSAYNAVGVYY